MIRKLASGHYRLYSRARSIQAQGGDATWARSPASRQRRSTSARSSISGGASALSQASSRVRLLSYSCVDPARTLSSSPCRHMRGQASSFVQVRRGVARYDRAVHGRGPSARASDFASTEESSVSNEQAAPETRGVTVKLLAAVDLGAEIEGMEGRQLRMRMVTIEPGGVFGPIHDHKGRPGTVYILQGTITDHRNGVATDYGPGVGWPEDRNTTHWLENRGTIPAVEISVDIVSVSPGSISGT